MVVAAGLLGSACSKPAPLPEEQWTIIKTEAAPLLRQPKETAEPQDIGRAGELGKVVREVKNLGLKEAKDLVESAPCTLGHFPEGRAREVVKELVEAGADAIVQ